MGVVSVGLVVGVVVVVGLAVVGIASVVEDVVEVCASGVVVVVTVETRTVLRAQPYEPIASD